MNNAIAPETLSCANSSCLKPNPSHLEQCQYCQSHLVRRLLWVVGSVEGAETPGVCLSDRYWVMQPRVVLDLQPGSSPVLPDDLPEKFLPYLRLFPQRFSVPQIYGFLKPGDLRSFLLEDVPVMGYGPGNNHTDPASLMPTLREAWNSSSPQRQLGWIWQMSKLWISLQQHKVAKSLLDPQLLRVDGSLIRLLEIKLEPESPTLAELAKFWEDLIPDAHPSIAPFLRQTLEKIHSREIRYPQPLTQLLEQALGTIAPTLDYTITIATATDPGPTRNNNEDACFPSHGSLITSPPGGESLAIVCDGLGGHDGGEVASAMAVKTITDLLSQRSSDPPFKQIHQAITRANDTISRRNNDEHRQERRRMGTTLVSALTTAPMVHLFHVGDSRAYWITPQACRQITVDDDLASRHVALGFGLYRSVVQSPTSGALVQALGMAPSSNLMPTIQSFFWDQPGLLLLCSDGLSDNELIEQLWQSILRPVAALVNPDRPTLEQALAQACHQLVEEANHRNGHDNVTVALLHYQVKAQGVPDGLALDALLAPSNLNSAEPLTEPIPQGTVFGDEDGTTDLRDNLMPPSNYAPDTQPSAVPVSDLSTYQQRPDPPAPWLKLPPMVIIWGLMVFTVLVAVVGSKLWSAPPQPTPTSTVPASPQPVESLPGISPTSTPESTTIITPASPSSPEDSNTLPPSQDNPGSGTNNLAEPSQDASGTEEQI